MATSSAEAVFCTPEIVRHIDTCTQLLPGVPASKRNLQPLWEHISDKKSWIDSEDDVQVVLMLHSLTKNKSRLEVHIEGPIEALADSRPQPFYGDVRTSIAAKSFEWSIDGLTEALAYARSVADRVRLKDFCPRCRVDGFKKTDQGAFENPHKKLKAHPLPYCADCTLGLAIGGPPQKKARW